MICTGLSQNPGGGGTTFGNVFDTTQTSDYLLNTSAGRLILEHENRHTYQWAQLGGNVPIFAFAYYVIGGSDPCHNWAEVGAVLKDGGYNC